MKIEKGKLYVYNGVVEMPMTDMDVEDGLYSNKIAVHCPTEEDWDYVVSKGYNLIETHNFFKGFFQIDGNGWCNDDGTWYENENYHIITIEEFKKFYPEHSVEVNEKVFNPQTHYDNSKGSLYKVATERNWNAYLFDVVKRLERGGKKDPLRQEIEKSIDVLKIWLNEIE